MELSSVLQPGTSIDGKYIVEAIVAEGGVGVVVRAMHVGLGQRVAIKFLKAEALQNPAWVERFEQEARVVAQIQSEHIVRVQDVGRMPGAGPYMVMEHLSGKDLACLVAAGPLPVETAVDYVLQACDAIAEAHVRGIVHRDIKPANLFLAQRPANTPILKVLDFGISKRTSRGGAALAQTTGAQELFGTPMYMSPEQLDAPAGVDARTDIWALGVVLHELVAGAPPFSAPQLPELFARILGREPAPLREVQPLVPVGLEAIVLKCLAKRREDRFRNIAELAQELAPYGGAMASARVDRIRQVVRSGGFSVMPAPLTPMVVAADSTAQVHVTDPPQVPMRSKTPLARVAVAVVVGLGALAALAFMRASSSFTSPSPSRETLASAAAALVQAPSPVPIERVTLAPPAEESAAPSPPAASATAAAPASSPTFAPAHTAPKPTLSPTPAPAPETATRRSLFGDRK